MALGFAILGAAVALNVSIQKRIAVWPLIDAVIDWNKVDEQIGSGDQTKQPSPAKIVSDGVGD